MAWASESRFFCFGVSLGLVSTLVIVGNEFTCLLFMGTQTHQGIDM